MTVTEENKTVRAGAAAGKAPVSVIVPVKNEEGNLAGCLEHLGWADEVFVVDSGSTDKTGEIAARYGAKVVQFRWDGHYPKKKNWALKNLPVRNEWMLIVDADEHIPAELAEEIRGVVANAGDKVGFYVNRKFIFMGQWLKHCGYYPSWNLRLLKKGHGEYEKISDTGDTKSGDNEVHEHVLTDGAVGWLKCEMIHYAFPTIDVFIEKHNRYSNWEALVHLEKRDAGLPARFFGHALERRRFLKRLAGRMPLRPTLRFLYAYVLRLGFLDGRRGWIFCRLLATYEFLSVAKYMELRESRSAEAGMRNAECEVRNGGREGRQETGVVRADWGGAGGGVVESRRNDVSVLPVSPERDAARGLRESAQPRGDLLGATAAATTTQRVTVLVLTLNEEINIRACLESFPAGTRVMILDSHSTDRTVEIAREMGVAGVHFRTFDHFAAQQNWAVEAIDFGTPWVYYADADERMTPKLWKQVLAAVEGGETEQTGGRMGGTPMTRPSQNVAYEIRRKDMFLGTWIKHSSFYPCWFARLFKPEKIRWERTGHVVANIDGPVGRLSEHFVHFPFSHGMSHWFNRHIYYSEREAHDMLEELAEPVRLRKLFTGNSRERRRTVKHLFYKLPCRPVVKFLVLYFLRLGFLDGRAGFNYAMMQAGYEYVISLQKMELKRKRRGLGL